MGAAALDGNIKRGDIFLVNMNNNVGCVQKGKRPALIVSNDLGNKFGPTVIIAPITSSSKRNLPTHLNVSPNQTGLNGESTILFEQIITLDKKQLCKKIGILSSSLVKEVNNRLNISLNLL